MMVSYKRGENVQIKIIFFNGPQLDPLGIVLVSR